MSATGNQHTCPYCSRDIDGKNNHAPDCPGTGLTYIGNSMTEWEKKQRGDELARIADEAYLKCPFRWLIFERPVGSRAWTYTSNGGKSRGHQTPHAGKAAEYIALQKMLFPEWEYYAAQVWLPK